MTFFHLDADMLQAIQRFEYNFGWKGGEDLEGDESSYVQGSNQTFIQSD